MQHGFDLPQLISFKIAHPYIMEINPNGDDFGGADAAFAVTGFSAFNQRTVESGFKFLAKIVNLAEKCGKIIHVKGLSCVLFVWKQ